jgi:hypothetical protein
VKGGRKVEKDDSNSSGKCSDENGNDNVNGDGDGDSNGDKVTQSKHPTKGLVKKSKKGWRSRGDFGHSVVETTKNILCKMVLSCTDRY